MRLCACLLFLGSGARPDYGHMVEKSRGAFPRPFVDGVKVICPLSPFPFYLAYDALRQRVEESLCAGHDWRLGFTRPNGAENTF
jgi:hypothetical protein